MLVKAALKPAITLAKRLAAKKQESAAQECAAKKGAEESDNDEFIQVAHQDCSQQEDLLLEMRINYLLETILLLRGEHLAALFLLFDCQPFSDSVVTRSLQLVFRLAKKPFPCFFQRLATKLRAFSQTLAVDKAAVGQQQVVPYMLEQKSSVRRLARDANAKFKLFMQRAEEQFGFVDAETPYEVAAKILVYSRDIQIDKIAEIIGGKEDKYKVRAFLISLESAPGIPGQDGLQRARPGEQPAQVLADLQTCRCRLAGGAQDPRAVLAPLLRT